MQNTRHEHYITKSRLARAAACKQPSLFALRLFTAMSRLKQAKAWLEDVLEEAGWF